MKLLALLLTALALAACSSPEAKEAPATVTVAAPAPAAETVTVEPPAPATETVTVEAPAPAPAPAKAEPTEDSVVDDAAINEVALQISWDGMSATEQEQICVGWEMDKEIMIDAFLGSDPFMPRSAVKGFFDRKC
ncbi:hypothetical protein [Ornithinimicrobium cryptoxanthini]|uniref:hypothetical protein n=1 Tax=Ornithinimicrobium cryptoxanthini TaxID=2934161 RepID=UPI0021184D44|nr:hypothetical protein [Ornithinimicrobium cryptoxanthini]